MAAVAILVLSFYFWRHAEELAEDEAKLIGIGRTKGLRAKYKSASVFLALFALALLGAGLR